MKKIVKKAKQKLVAKPPVRKAPVKTAAKPKARRVNPEVIETAAKTALPALPSPNKYQREVIDFEARGNDILAEAEKFQNMLAAPEDEQKLSARLGEWKAMKTAIVNFYDGIIDPIDDVVSALKAQCDELTTPIERAIEIGKTELGVYYKMVDQQKVLEAQAEFEERAKHELNERKKRARQMFKEGATPEEVNAFLSKPSDVTPAIPERAVASAGNQRRTIPQVVITDEEVVRLGHRHAETVLPDEFWVLDMVALRAALVGSKTGNIKPRKVPGAKITNEPIVAVKEAKPA